MNRSSITTVAVVLAASMTLAACGGASDADNGPEGPGGAQSADTLNIGVHVEPTDWSPSRIQTILFPFTRQVYESLITYDDELNPSPQLATEWEINEDQTAVMITLREDVSFHSGAPLDAEAVAANLEFFADPETGQQMFGPMSAVADWEVVDELTLQVNFTDPVAELQITDLLQSWTIGDPDSLDDSSKGVGTGPFTFSEWVSGERIVLERNEDYWGESPAYQTLHYRVFGDMDSLISGFESGVIDVAVDVPPLDAQRLEEQATVLTGNAGTLIDQWRINPSVAPFDNENVRLAINYATDRQSIVDALYHGFAEPATLPYGPHSPAYDPDLAAELDFDLERARDLLAESGLSADELSASIMVTSANARTEQAAQILQSSLDEIGFTLEIEVRDNAEYTEKMLAGDFQIVFSAIGNGQKYPTRITTNSIYRIEDNPVGATDLFPEYAPAVAAANAAVTEEEQAQAFANLNEVLAEAMWVPTVGYLPTLWLINSDVTGVERDVDNMLLLAGAAPTN